MTPCVILLQWHLKTYWGSIGWGDTCRWHSIWHILICIRILGDMVSWAHGKLDCGRYRT